MWFQVFLKQVNNLEIVQIIQESCYSGYFKDYSYLQRYILRIIRKFFVLLGEDRRKWETEFGIKHYAGCVTYNVKGFVDKNRDVQQDVFFDILSRSSNEFVQELYTFQDPSNTLTQKTVVNGVSTVSRGTSKGKPTVSDTFRHQLQALVDVLQVIFF